MKMILTPATPPDGHIEPRLKPGGRYELATLELRQNIPLLRETVVRLAVVADRLNRSMGDPTS